MRINFLMLPEVSSVPPLSELLKKAIQARSSEVGSSTRRPHLLALVLACLLPDTLPAISPEEHATIGAELSEPITLRLDKGQRISGNPIFVSNEQIQIASAEGAGEIIFTFKISEVDGLSIPGESYKALAAEWMHTGQSEDALELMRMLYEQRKTLLHLLPPSESHFFTYYVDLVLDSPHPARAVAIIETLRPQIKNPAAIRALDDALLKSYQRLELHDEAIPLAEALVEKRKPYGESALGYYVLGAAKIREEAYEEALDLALRPIVFASPLPTDQLAECYAVAVSAALGLRERAYAATLFREMQARGFEWPRQDRSLQTFLKDITAHTANYEKKLPKAEF